MSLPRKRISKIGKPPQSWFKPVFMPALRLIIQNQELARAERNLLKYFMFHEIFVVKLWLFYKIRLVISVTEAMGTLRKI